MEEIVLDSPRLIFSKRIHYECVGSKIGNVGVCVVTIALRTNINNLKCVWGKKMRKPYSGFIERQSHTTFAKNESSFTCDSGKIYRRINLSVFKSNITRAGGVICIGFPKISAKPVSITHNLSHSSTRIRNVEIIVSLLDRPAFDCTALGAFARPPTII